GWARADHRPCSGGLVAFWSASEQEPVFQVVLAGREINRWTFEELYLWELDARQAVKHGAPGVWALVPLMRGGRDHAVFEEAVRRIEKAFPQTGLSEAEDVLLALAQRYYTVTELSRIVGRDRMIQGSIYEWGRQEGRLDAERRLCAALVRKHHPGVFEKARPLIDACQDPDRLESWALAASDLSDADFLRLIGA